MIKNFLLLFVSAAAAVLPGQSVKVVRFPGKSSGQPDRTVRVWLPKDYSKANKYPVIFTLAGKDELIAHVAHYYMEARHQIPPVIVVGINADVNEVGFSYETGGVNDAGAQFAKYFSGQLLPYLQENYSTARFRVFIGHSYSATYTDYLLREHPLWFSGYALLTPEQPSYKLDYAPLLRRLPSPFYYYVASGQLDMERRQEHAGFIAGQFTKRPDALHFKHEMFPEGDHLTTVPRALPAALEFLFAGYKDFAYTEPDGDLTRWFEALEQRTRDLYGFGIRKDSSNAAYFCQLAVEKKDLKALQAMERFFVNPQSDASVVFNTAQYYCALGDFERGEQLLRRAVARSKQTKRSDFLLMSHRTLALRVYSGHQSDPPKAWKALEEGYLDTRDVAFKYYFGLIAARHGYRLDDGIRHLLAFETERSQSFFGTLYKLDDVYTLVGRCYLRKQDKAAARAYVDKALNLNPENEDALQLRSELEKT